MAWCLDKGDSLGRVVVKPGYGSLDKYGSAQPQWPNRIFGFSVCNHISQNCGFGCVRTPEETPHFARPSMAFNKCIICIRRAVGAAISRSIICCSSLSIVVGWVVPASSHARSFRSIFNVKFTRLFNTLLRCPCEI